MLLRLFLLFTLLPTIELYLLLQLGSWMGPTATLLFVLLTGVAGAALAKREGLAVLREVQGELTRGLPPAARLMEAAMIVVGGLLLVTPGVLTDLTGVLLIFPPTRRFLAPRALAWLQRRIEFQSVGAFPGAGYPPQGDPSGYPGERPPRGPSGARRGEVPPFANPFDDLP